MASLGWFWSYSLTLIAYVKAVGQLESVFAVGLTLYVFRESEVSRQIPGIILTIIGILLVVLA
jgi:drug/metabolite transporter (DMT)-like permease